MKATLIDEKDNVAVVLGAVKAGEEITWFRGRRSLLGDSPAGCAHLSQDCGGSHCQGDAGH